MAHPAIGITGPNYEFAVERGKVREFARAIGAQNPEYVLGATPVVPPTFLTIAGRLWGYTFDQPGNTGLKDIDIDRALLLNAEEDFEYPEGLPRAGDLLIARTYVKDLYTKRGKRGGELTFVIVETVFEDDRQRVVARQRQTLVRTQSVPQTGS